MKKLAYCAKFMHMLHGFNLAVLTELELALKEDIKADQTHISEPRFLKLAEPIIKIPNLGEHKLFELIKEACVDPTLKSKHLKEILRCTGLRDAGRRQP
jgi:hypothetical protein